MSDLTGDSEYGSTSSSPLLPITFSPENEILTPPQSQSSNLEPNLSSWEHGSTSALPEPEIQMAENIPPTVEILIAPQSQSSNLEPLSSWEHAETAPGEVLWNSQWEHGSASALPETQMAVTIPRTVEILTAPQSQSSNLEPLSSWEQYKIQTAEPETIRPTPTAPPYEFQHGPETANLLSIETRENNIINSVPFYHAAINGDWRKAKKICERQPDIVRARITSESETGLHIAAAAKNLSFVKMLVDKMTPDDIRMTSNSNNTALCFAAASGIVDIAKVIVAKVEDLPLVRGKGGMTPLHMAAELGHKNMVKYLLPLTDVTDVDKKLTTEEVMELFISLINTNLYEVAVDLLMKYPTLATARDKQRETALHVLARKPLSSKVDLDRGHWKGFITSGFSIDDSIISHKNYKALLLVKHISLIAGLSGRSISELITVPTKLLFVATKSGNVEFITILMKYYLDLIWSGVDHEDRSMFHVAVYERQENIFRIINEIGAIKDIILGRNDNKNNNMLHMAAKLAPSNRLGIVSGAALQLQRELMWFKEVEKIVPPSYKETKNTEGFTPKELFVAEHKELREEGEKWMKSTAQSCMIVSTLIATVMFAAVFNLPGGRKADGTPTYLKKPSFIIFVIADSMSLFSSITTIFVFLSILTSRYKEDDFLHALPNKLMQGLSTLFLSMVTMMIAFTTSMFIVFPEKSHIPAIPISSMACIPVGLYALFHYKLFADIFSSTYSSRFIFQAEGNSLTEGGLMTQAEETS